MSNEAQANGGKPKLQIGETKMAVYSQKSAGLIERNLARHGFASVSVAVSEFADKFALEYWMDDTPSEGLAEAVSLHLHTSHPGTVFVWANLFPSE